ncbi:hypothetical protein ABL78_1186 [Leptomonas seymouri]|uniref:Uncharacterized protein n=1 Tax=Leptomonas seymouri TaxID=5684 RepID=A0A0N1PE43_LEPSE|nr:hypothetical protein ABL78_1186 [Leptomonas seymouri]|eukprot:KPI89693.1 hypothetical protein ABL78_1186 [Leptomonas seymouri]
MARRDRVPRHKSHNHKRNKNAKLSPFQREQKRAKLANQVPTPRTMGDLDSIPHSQRHVFHYLQEKSKRQKEKRAALELERQQEREVTVGTKVSITGNGGSSTAEPSGPQNGAAPQKASKSATAARTERSEPAVPPSTAKTSKKAKVVYPSLNEELTASVGAALQPISRRSKDGASTSSERTADPNAPRSVEEIIARKKERKHQRKQEARRARVAAQLEHIEAELEDYVNNATPARKRGRARRGEEDGERRTERDRVNATFEHQLRAMQKDDARKEAERQLALVGERKKDAASSRKRHRTGASRDRDANGNGADEAARCEDREGSHMDSKDDAAADELPRQRKRISFGPEVADPTAAQSARHDAKKKKPQDFYELVDVVRYGERVEAPPVFDVLPNRNAAVSRLANQLEREASGNRARRPGADERHRLLSGGGQLGEQKRLARLGLAPAITHTVRADTSAAASRMSKEEEIKALRDRVMATYQRNRKKVVAERKGVDMRHEFPKFA